MQFQTILDVYQAIIDLAPTGQADLFQAEIAEKCNLSIRHIHRALKELKAANWLEIIPLRDRYGKYRKFRYITLIIPYPSDSVSPMAGLSIGLTESDGCREKPCKSISIGLSESDMHDHDDDEFKKIKGKKIWSVLDFLHEGERARRIRQKHCTLAFAKKWREWWDRAEFGNLVNPAGWANIQMRQGLQPPQQIPLPEGALSFETQKSWYTMDEANLIQR